MTGSATLAGPATREQCPHIILKGNAYQRGVQYGKAFKRHLPVFYDWFVQKPVADVLTEEYRAILEELETTFRRVYPQLFDEIKGRADGSGMSYDACRIMAFHNDIRPLLKPGCSNVLTTGGPDGPWLARTCDLHEDERCWQILIISLADDALSHATTTYLGLMVGLGVNAAGLAVGGSSSSSSTPPSAKGLANATLVMLATLKSVADCCRLASETGLTGKGANLALLDASGDAAVIEYAPGLLAIRRPDRTGFLAHTNHSITGKIPRPPAWQASLENSRARYDHLCAMVGQAAPECRTVELAKNALADHAGEHHVCQHIPKGFNTIYSWVIQPGIERSIMHFAWGYPCEMRYEKIDLDWAKMRSAM
ncbi:MAG: C45 family autoproteolytic acyltransferase/hydrolase [Kiritimatiellae bacterium]|nr:C45 family autoproteolytic acyltransferase/hydrolase [Kiritimatiellia bacterium]